MIAVYNKQTKEGGIFTTTTEAARFLGIHPETIRRANGHKETSNYLIFMADISKHPARIARGKAMNR